MEASLKDIRAAAESGDARATGLLAGYYARCDSERDDEAAYAYYVRAEQRGLGCSEMLSLIKKKFLDSHVFTG